MGSLIRLVVFVLSAASLQNSTDPLPDVDSLWAKVRPGLAARYFEFEALKGYTYKRNAVIDELGRGDVVKKTQSTESEVYFFDSGRFEKMIRINGQAPSEDFVRKQDQAFQNLRSKGPARKSGWPPWNQRKTPKELDERLTDLFNAFDFTVVRREMRFYRPTIVIDFKPKKRPQLKTMVARMMLTKMEGTAWIDERDSELAKVEIRYFKDVKVALGMLATLGDESESTREWRKVNDEIWLPLRNDTRVKGRAWFFVDGFNMRIREEFSDYKKFTVTTNLKVIGN